MYGLVLYSFAAAGLGLLLPALPARISSIGCRFFGGFALLILIYVLTHLALGLSLRLSAMLILAIALAGFARQLLSHRWTWEWALHPVPILLVVGGLVIFVNGGIGYLPYASDDFSNWLGASRHIFMAGDYDLIRESIRLPTYTPGWRLAVLFPWAVLGEIDEGASASAPFVMLVGLSGFIFDLTVWRLRETGLFRDGFVRMLGWLTLLCASLVEVAGLLWTRILLIEPPQIYSVAGAFLVLIAWDMMRRDWRPALYAGLLLTEAYLMKTAALAALPGIGLLIFVQALRAHGFSVASLRQTVATGLLVFVPPLLMVWFWGAYAPPFDPGLPSMGESLRGEWLAKALAADWGNLAWRFGLEVGGYLLSYKAPLTVVSIIAIGFAALRGRYAGLLTAFAFFVLYMASLYWYHLAALGPNYYWELNSIPRFTRVPLQALHVVGLMVGIIEITHLLRDGRLRTIVTAIAGSRPFLFGGTALCLLLFGVEVGKIDRSVVDVTTRKYQMVDPRIAETRQALALLAQHAGQNPPAPPRLVLIAQGQDSEPMNYAHYYGRGVGPSGEQILPFEVQGVSWPEPQDPALRPGGAKEVRALFLSADLIWLIALDEWVRPILAGIVETSRCPRLDESVFLLRESTAEGRPFVCRAKPGS
jgi:hypothetical protein